MYVYRVPASVFRFYFFELWAALYPENSLILISDFKDVFFQADPFAFKRHHWMPDYHLAVFKVCLLIGSFHPSNSCIYLDAAAIFLVLALYNVCNVCRSFTLIW